MNSEKNQNKPYYVPIRKFILLNFATLTFFQVYWGYRQWKYLRDIGKNPQAIPWLAGLFLPLTYYWLLKSFSELKNKGQEVKEDRGIWIMLVISLIILNLFANFDGYIAGLTFLAFWPLLYGAKLINEYAVSINPKLSKVPPMPWWKRFLVAFGILIMAIIIPLMMMPQEKVNQLLEKLKEMEEMEDKPTIEESLVKVL